MGKQKGAGKTAPNIITIEGNKYKRVNLKTQWTLKQNMLAKPLVKELIQGLTSAIDFNTIDKDAVKEGMKIVENILSIDIEVKLLALLFINADEKHFIKETYNGRMDIFEGMPIEAYEKMKPSIEEFIDFLLPKIAADTRIYMETMTKM